MNRRSFLKLAAGLATLFGLRQKPEEPNGFEYSTASGPGDFLTAFEWNEEYLDQIRQWCLEKRIQPINHFGRDYYMVWVGDGKSGSGYTRAIYI